MKLRYLGKSGLAVSELTLGTMTFGVPSWGCDEQESHRIIEAYIEEGGNMLDCADVYAKGESERIIGSFLPSIRRDDVLIASKCNFPFDQSPNGIGSSRKHIITSVEASLKRLNTDYIDIYYLHRPDPTVSADEIMETLDILKQQGKILYSACSNLPAWRLVVDSMEAKIRHNSTFVCGQYMYNMIDRNCEQEIIPAMIHEGIGILCWSPLAGGLLTGKYYGDNEVPKNSRFDYRKNLDVPRFWTTRGKQIADALQEFAFESGIPATRLAIAWLLDKPYVSSVILGAKSVDQLKESLAGAEVVLTAELREKLDAICALEKSYLWTFNEATNKQLEERAALFPGTVIV
jgi:aryl-alcohol dehydrogenase-like predicted oxidoreductase